MSHPILHGGVPAPHASRLRGLLPPGFAGTIAFFLLFLPVGMALLVFTFWIAVRLTPEAVSTRVLALDHALMLWFRARGTDALDRAAVEVTFVGARLVGWVLLLAVTSFLWMMRERIEVLFLWTSFLGSILLSLLLKSIFGRPRPDPEQWRIAWATDGSFPSGHAINAVVVFGGLFWVIRRLGPSPALRRIAFVLGVAAILLIGLSRPYLGVHFPLDVVAGYFAGAAWLAVCALATGAVIEPRAPRPEVRRR
jgi:membrane-associated phospholipid phosphatase